MNHTSYLSFIETVAGRALVLLAFCWGATDVAADSNFAPVVNYKWQAECGSCHLAYPPQLLPAANWRRASSNTATGWPPEIRCWRLKMTRMIYRSNP